MSLLWVAQALAACPPMDDALESATRALVDGAAPDAAFASAEASLACAPVTRPQLARLWLLHGAARLLAGDAAGAEPFLAAAATLDATVWDERLGPAVRTALDSAKHGLPGSLLATRPVTVDGEKVAKFPVPVESGPHALQAPDAAWARVVVVAPAETLRVDVPAAAPKERAKKKSAAWAVAGGVALAGAIGCGVSASLQSDTMADAPSVAALNDAWAMQTALGSASLALGALGATGVVLQFALP